MKRSAVIRSVIVPAFFLLSVFFSANLLAQNESSSKVVFIPQWAPQAQFAGYYVALDKGIYKKHGLDVTVLEGGPERSPEQYLRTGKADLASMWLSAGISERAKGNAVVEIAQMMQKSSLILVAKKQNGIKDISDIKGRKVGVWDGLFGLQVRILLESHKLQAKIIPQTYSVNLFLRSGVDLISAMWYNEYHTILNAGYDPEDLQVFFLSEQGLNFPEDGIFARDEFFRKSPAVCSKFVRATIEGWQEAFEHPDEAVDIVLKHMLEAHIPADRPHQKWMLARMKDLMVEKDGDASGVLLRADYEKVGQALVKYGFIKDLSGYDDFYKGKMPS